MAKKKYRGPDPLEEEMQAKVDSPDVPNAGGQGRTTEPGSKAGDKPARRISVAPDGSLRGPDGEVVDRATLSDAELKGVSAQRGPSGYQNPGKNGEIGRPDLYTRKGPPRGKAPEPAAKGYLDEERAKTQGRGYKSADEALAASIREQRRQGETKVSGYAVSGPGGQWYSSNDERDRARSSGTADEKALLAAFDQIAPSLGYFRGPGGAYTAEGRQGFERFVQRRMANRDVDAKGEEQRAKEYALSTRGPQEDATKLEAERIQARGGTDRAKIQADAQLKAAEMNVKGQFSAEQMRQIGELFSQGRFDEAKSLAATYKALQADSRPNAGPPGSITLTSDLPPPGDTATDQAAKGAELARRLQSALVELGRRPIPKAKGDTSPDKYKSFDVERALQIAMSQPDIVRAPGFAEAFMTGGNESRDAIRDAVRDRFLQGVLRPGPLGSVFANEVDRGPITVGGLVVNPVRSKGAWNRHDIYTPGGQRLTSTKELGLPVGGYLSGTRRFFPRPFTSQAELDRENAALGELMKSLYGVK